MQTFLAFPSYTESAACLDKSRLGNQFYREGIILIRGGWKNHPASKMWAGHLYSLGEYLLACYEELKKRGRIYDKHADEVRRIMDLQENKNPPKWLGDKDFHASHRAALLFKNFEHYKQFRWEESPKIEYIWPSKQNKVIF